MNKRLSGILELKIVGYFCPLRAIGALNSQPISLVTCKLIKNQILRYVNAAVPIF